MSSPQNLTLGENAQGELHRAFSIVPKNSQIREFQCVPHRGKEEQSVLFTTLGLKTKKKKKKKERKIFHLFVIPSIPVIFKR